MKIQKLIKIFFYFSLYDEFMRQKDFNTMQLNSYINTFYISKINIAKLEAIKLEGDDLDGYKVNCLKCGSESSYHPFQISVKCKFCTTETPVYDICMGLTGLSCQQFVSLLEA
jgi:hypothetical protein